MTENTIEQFLREAGFENIQRTPLAGDASKRRYERVHRRDCNSSHILMIAPTESCGPLEPFITVGSYLNRAGLTVPEIIAQNPAEGLLLLEDFGDAIVSKLASKNAELEQKIYDTAIDALIELHSNPEPEQFKLYQPHEQVELSALAFKWYAESVLDTPTSTETLNAFRDAFSSVILLSMTRRQFIHRDFHSENLIWLPEREGVQRLGILDFQDGARGNSTYDLVSLLEDARRDVPQEIVNRSILRYCELTGMAQGTALIDMAVCGAQRSLRILGVFARLAVRDAKPNYLQFLPRVWNQLQNNLSHPALKHIAPIILEALPPPNPSILRSLCELSKCRPARP